jgi:hypothetical protein
MRSTVRMLTSSHFAISFVFLLSCMCLTIAARLSFGIGLTNVPSHDYTTVNAYKKSMCYITYIGIFQKKKRENYSKEP